MDTLPQGDRDMFLDMAARNLARNLGEKALPYAHAALEKMRLTGDADGFDIWAAIERRLAFESGVGSTTLH